MQLTISKIMLNLLEFIHKERLYFLLLIFVLLIAAITAEHGESKDKRKTVETALEKMDVDSILARREAMEERLGQNKPLAVLFSLTSLLMMMVFFLGIFIDTILVSFGLSRKKLDIRTATPGIPRWNLWDVSRVVILFLFFGYMLVIIEAALSLIFPILKNDNLRMMFNSSTLDILTVVFVIYLTVYQYKEKLISLGLSLKNFSRNIFYGIVGYIATIPVLTVVLILILIIVQFTKYVPERQPVVDLFLKEEDPAFLAYSSLFAAVVGPFIEELFFRGFMYNAVKKYTGILWATLITAGVFAALHSNLVGFLPIMVIGILLTYLYEKTGTLVASVTVHIMHNLSMVYFVFLMKQIKI